MADCGSVPPRRCSDTRHHISPGRRNLPGQTGFLLYAILYTMCQFDRKTAPNKTGWPRNRPVQGRAGGHGTRPDGDCAVTGNGKVDINVNLAGKPPDGPCSPRPVNSAGQPAAAAGLLGPGQSLEAPAGCRTATVLLPAGWPDMCRIASYKVLFQSRFPRRFDPKQRSSLPLTLCACDGYLAPALPKRPFFRLWE